MHIYVSELRLPTMPSLTLFPCGCKRSKITATCSMCTFEYGTEATYFDVGEVAVVEWTYQAAFCYPGGQRLGDDFWVFSS